MNLRHKRAQPNTLVVSFLRLGTLNDQEAVNRCVQIVSTKSAWLLSKSQHLMFVRGDQFQGCPGLFHLLLTVCAE